MGLDDPAFAEDHRPLDDVLQFAHVARPVVAHQHAQGPRGDVGAALAQRRHGDGEDVEPVIEILAEAALLYHASQVVVGGGEDAQVDLVGEVTADPFEALLLEHPQQLGLHGQGQLADLVEKDGAAVGHLETPAPLVGRPGEGAASRRASRGGIREGHGKLRSTRQPR
ncbi:hypothetical protein GCM10027398_44490 [Azotobacter salinestris]